MIKPSIKEKNREIGRYIGKVLSPERHDFELVRTGGLYHKSWNWLMVAVEKLHEDYFKDHLKVNTVDDTIKLLLYGGYRTTSNNNLPTLKKTIENLHDRVYHEIMFRKKKEKSNENS